MKCGDGRRPRPEDGFWVPVPLVLRSEDFEGEVEWEGGCFGRDILREAWGLHGELHGEVEGDKVGKFKANGLPGWPDQVT